MTQISTISKSVLFILLFIASLGWAAPETLRSVEGLTEELALVFSQVQATRVLSDGERWRQVVEKLSGAEAGLEVQDIFEHDKALFAEARERALAKVPVRSNGKHLVVSGLSVSGTSTALLAANVGYSVTGFEAREQYTRNIQWTGRQCIINTLALLGQKIADEFLRTLVHPLDREIDRVNDTINQIVTLHQPKRGNAADIPDTPGEMLNQDTVMIMQIKKIEEFLLKTLKENSQVDIRLGQPLALQATHDGYTVADIGAADLIVIAEGSGSKTRAALGIKSAPSSPIRWQIAGELNTEDDGHLIFNEKHVTYEDGSQDILLTSAISNKDSERNWTVTDVPKNLNLEPVGFSPDSLDYRREKQNLVDNYYYSALAKVLARSEADVRTMSVSGPVEGTSPTAFRLQQNMSQTARFGSNVIGLGDTVGNAHWNVGGGVHIAMVSHLKRLANLFFDLEMGRDREEALAEYDARVRVDTMEWGRRGIVDFYPEYDPQQVRASYDEAINEWTHNSSTTSWPLEILERKIQSLDKIKDPKSVEILSCSAVF